MERILHTRPVYECNSGADKPEFVKLPYFRLLQSLSSRLRLFFQLDPLLVLGASFVDAFLLFLMDLFDDVAAEFFLFLLDNVRLSSLLLDHFLVHPAPQRPPVSTVYQSIIISFFACF